MDVLTGIIQSDTLWFEDGNIILVAGNEAFRVHRGVLSKHSAVFRDLFTVPQPSCSLLVDGCAIVHLPDDPLHLQFLLRSMYDRSFFNGAGKLSWIAEVACGILSLAHKYVIEDFYEEAICRLLEDYPATFDRLRSTEQYSLEPFEPAHHTGAVFLVNAARRICTPELIEFLPFAFYLCCLLDGSQLVQGVLRANGELEKLSAADLRRCINGKEQLMRANSAATMCLGPSAKNLAGDCKTPDACKGALVHITHDALDGDIFSACDALTNIDSWIEAETKTHGLCDRCTRQVRDTHREAQKEIWDGLGPIFDLRDDCLSSAESVLRR